MMVLLLVVIAHTDVSLLLDQQYLYDVIDPLVIAGGSHATKIIEDVFDNVCTDNELCDILPGAVKLIMGKLSVKIIMYKWNCTFFKSFHFATERVAQVHCTSISYLKFYSIGCKRI